MGPVSGIVNYGLRAATISYSPAQTITLPFEFEPVAIGTPTTPQLLPDFGSVDFINLTGSSALTLFSMLDALAFLGILIVIYLAVKVLVWLYRFVTDLPANTELDVNSIAGTLKHAGEWSDEEVLSTAGKVLNTAKRRNPFKF